MAARRLIAALDDAATFTRLLEGRQRQLVYGGVQGIEPGVILWHYLRARHYGRHSLVAALTAVAQLPSRRRQEGLELLLESFARFEATLALEGSAAQWLEGDWAVGEIASEVIRRGPLEAIDEVNEAARVTPLGADLLEEDDLALVEGALFLRHDCRVVAWELGLVSKASPDPLINLAPRIQSADGTLRTLVSSSSALERCASSLTTRFYQDLGVIDRRMPEYLNHPLLEHLLHRADFPWLSDATPRLPTRQSRWWL